MNILDIINEEIEKLAEEWYDDDEPSLADKVYAKRFGIDTKQPQAASSSSDGELLGFVGMEAYRKLDNPVPVYKNPISLAGFTSGARGVLFSNGDIYIGKRIILHFNLFQLLTEKGLVPYNTPDNYDMNPSDDFIAVEREGRSNVFGQSSAYDKIPDSFQEIFNRGNQVHSYKFKIVELA